MNRVDRVVGGAQHMAGVPRARHRELADAAVGIQNH